MLKNVYICFGNFAIYSIKKYIEQESEFLEENGFWAPTMQELGFEMDASDCARETLYGSTFILQKVWSAKYHDLNLKDVLKNIEVQARAKKNIHSICLFTRPSGVNTGIDLLFWATIKQVFSEYNVQARCVRLPVGKEMEYHWSVFSENSITAVCNFLQARLLQSSNDWYVYSTYAERLKRFIDVSMPIVFTENEKDIVKQWAMWVNLPDLPTQHDKQYVWVLPKVRVFLKAITSPSRPYISWYNQYKLVQYGMEDGVSYTCIPPYIQKKMRTLSEEVLNISPDYSDETEQQYKGDDSLLLSPADALTFASLIESSLREECIRDCNREMLSYFPINQRIAFAALLFVENEINQDEFDILTADPQGMLLPYDDLLHDGVHIEMGKEAPRVAVLTLCYNHEKFIEENIQSVLAQKTNFPVTHIIADDASTDGSQEILLEYARKYPHIELILQEKNIGAGSKNVFDLFNHARTEYVALCDGDDYFLSPHKLQKQMDLLEKNLDYGLCFHPVLTVFEDEPEKQIIFPFPKYLPRGISPYYYLIDLIRINFIQTNSVMYRWRFPEGLPGWFDSTLCPADWYWHLLHAECGKIGFQNEIMSVYRRHKGGIFFDSVESPHLLRRKYGKQEVNLYISLDNHFEGKYSNIFHKNQMNVFTSLAVDANENEDFSYLNELVENYPHLGKEFMDSLQVDLKRLNNAIIKE